MLDVDQAHEVEIVVTTRLSAPHRAVIVSVYVLRAPDCHVCRRLRSAGLRVKDPAPVLAAARIAVATHPAAVEFPPLRYDQHVAAMVMRPSA